MKDAINSSSVKLQYGLRNGRLVHISDIPKTERGLKCKCECPACGADLQAKLGNGGRKPHFSHSNSGCSYMSAQQTILHMLAKDIINEELKIKLPAITIPFREIKLCKDNPTYLEYSYDVEENLEYQSACLVVFDRAELENRVSSVVPDVTLYKNGKVCLIEIAVTHFVDDKKEEKIKNLKLPTIEIDMSSFSFESISKDELRDIIINDTDNKRWVYNPQLEKAYEWANDEYKAKIDDIVREQRELAEVEKTRIQKKIERIELTKKAFFPDNYTTEITKLRNDNKAINLYKSLWMSKYSPEIPFYCDIPIYGEFIFNCDRRVWQTAIFNKFIYNRKPSEHGRLCISYNKIEYWLKEVQKDIKVNWKYYHRIDGNGKQCNLLKEVVLKYLWYLNNLGFIDYDVYGYKRYGYIDAIETLNPPDATFADKLKIALDSVDGMSIYADSDILECLNILSTEVN